MSSPCCSHRHGTLRKEVRIILQYGYRGFCWDFQLRCNLLSVPTTNKHNKAMDGPPLEFISDHSKYPSPPIWCTANTCSLFQLKAPQASCSSVNKETKQGGLSLSCVTEGGRQLTVWVVSFFFPCSFVSEINACGFIYAHTKQAGVRGWGQARMSSSVIIGILLRPIRSSHCEQGLRWWPSLIAPWKGRKRCRNMKAPTCRSKR